VVNDGSTVIVRMQAGHNKNTTGVGSLTLGGTKESATVHVYAHTAKIRASFAGKEERSVTALHYTYVLRPNPAVVSERNPVFAPVTRRK